ncbi:hypothetical protein K470DRAFT_16248 [Piedraia hortae CBS 480.64]|uniref:THUMP domain-containing protein n=1 Tax=Piedraia hortae CBS 480.64 TaxID=1314780 RepID=A0A6A7C3V4_9PEZI|nr:hypothetical protein K470DRAFT_16248 [Piedraia hortae CBS 480.64]
MDAPGKRKRDNEHSGNQKKRTITKKQWRVLRKNEYPAKQSATIQPGDSGIWATCNKGKEGKCVTELRELFNVYAEKLYPTAATQQTSAASQELIADDEDIEQAIQREVAEIRKPSTPQLFTHVHINMPCVVFFKTIAPVDPVSLVRQICEDVLEHRELKRTHFVMRLSPMTMIRRASTEGLEKVAREVLYTHFHQGPASPKKFAIRPTIRNHDTLTREEVIKQVASIVGPNHSVDLKYYDLLIIVEIYKNVCGMAVVDGSFERLKRYNVSELLGPTPKDAIGQMAAA